MEEFYVESLDDAESLRKPFDNSLDAIYFNNILDFVDNEKKQEYIFLCANKLAHGGVLEISGVDLIEVSRSIYNRMMECKEAYKFLTPFVLSIFDVLNYLEISGFQILIKRVNDHRYYIKAMRP